MSVQVNSAIGKQNELLKKTVFKMKQILAGSTSDPVKIKVVKRKVKQARLVAERDYLRACLGEEAPEKRYATDTAARIGDLLARKAAEAHAKKHRTPPTDSDGLQMPDMAGAAAPTTGPNTMLRKISSKNQSMSAEEQEMERKIAAKQAEIEQKRQALAAKQAASAAERQAAEAERQAAAARARANTEAEAAEAAAAAKAAAAAAADRRQADATTTAAQHAALQQATAEQAEHAAKRAEQSSKLEQLLKEEQELQRAAEAEEVKKSAHEIKLAEAQAQAEAKRAAEEEERSRRKRVTEDAARREAELKVRDAAARALEEEEAAVSAAPTDHDLTEWHGTANTAAALTPEERMRQIEEAERQAIAEMDEGSANNNDDAILQAMKKTNPEAYAELSASRQTGGPDVIATKTRAAKQQLRNDRGIPTLARNMSPTKVALADADYLLSMITSGTDEDSELKDLDNGARYHVNMEGEKVYRMSDLPTDQLDDYMSLNGSPPGSPAPAADWGTTTMERRTKNLSDVERRKAEAETRKQEAWARSMDRSKGKKNKKDRKARKQKISETPM